MHSNSHAHKYYFGFAEVQYNFFSQRFEATLTVTAHDLEMAFSAKNNEIGNLETIDSTQSVIITNYINSSFELKSGGNSCDFIIIGHETKLTGEVHFYLESTQIEIKESIEVEFDILMDTYKEQQNKITFYHLKRAYTVPFTQGNKKQTIQLENNTE